MTSFSDFVKKVFNVGKQKTEQMDFGAPLTTFQTLLKTTKDHEFTSASCASLIEYLPDISKGDNISLEEKDSLLQSLRIVREFYLRSKKESNDVIFWFNQYIKECSNYGKAS